MGLDISAGAAGRLAIPHQLVDSLLDDLDEFFERDLPLALHESQDCEIDLHRGASVFS